MPGRSKKAKVKKSSVTNMTLEELMVFLTGLDQSAKSCIDKMPPEDFPHPVPELDNKLIICRNHNAGLPFGIFADNQDLTKVLPTAVTSMLAGCYIYLKSRGERKFFRLALALAISGSLSNIIDRFTRGYVVDYICVAVGDLGKVVFNLGDLCVIMGFSLMSITELLRLMGLHGT